MSRRRRVMVVGYVGLVIAAVGVTGLRSRPYVARAWHNVGAVDPGWLAVAVGAELISMGAFARLQRRLLTAGGTRLSLREALAVTYAANALSVTLPGGTAVAAGYAVQRFRGEGATTSAAAFAVAASNVLSVGAFGVLAIAGGTDAVSADVVVCEALVAVAAAVLIRVYVTHPGMAGRHALRVLERVNRLGRRDRDLGKSALRAIEQQIRSIRPSRWDWSVALYLALLNWVADMTALCASLRAVHAPDVSLALVLAVYVVGTGASSLSPIPAGIGVADAAMVVLLGHGEVTAATATAGLLIYRMVSVGFLLTAGWTIWAVELRRRQRGHVPSPLVTGAARREGRPAHAAPPEARIQHVRGTRRSGPSCSSTALCRFRTRRSVPTVARPGTPATIRWARVSGSSTARVAGCSTSGPRSSA